MKRELTVDPDEVADAVREARRLVTFGGSVVERALYAARKEDLLVRMAKETACSGEGGPG